MSRTINHSVVSVKPDDFTQNQAKFLTVCFMFFDFIKLSDLNSHPYNLIEIIPTSAFLVDCFVSWFEDCLIWLNI